MEKLITRKEAARILGISIATLDVFGKIEIEQKGAKM